MTLLLLTFLACVVVPQSPGGDDTNKHSTPLAEPAAEAPPPAPT